MNGRSNQHLPGQAPSRDSRSSVDALEQPPRERSIFQSGYLASRVEQVVVGVPEGKEVIGYRDESVDASIRGQT